MEIITQILVTLGFIGAFIVGIVSHKAVAKPVPEPKEVEIDTVYEYENETEEDPIPPPDPVPTGTYDIYDFEMDIRDWYGLRLHSYDLGTKYRLDEVELKLDMVDDWSGANQILIYMSDSPLPESGNDEIWWIDDGIRWGVSDKDDTPWLLVENLKTLPAPEQVKYPASVRSGRYFIIAMTNKHDFDDEGTIKIVRK